VTAFCLQAEKKDKRVVPRGVKPGRSEGRMEEGGCPREIGEGDGGNELSGGLFGDWLGLRSRSFGRGG